MPTGRKYKKLLLLPLSQPVYPVHGGININGTVYAISVPDAMESSAMKYGRLDSPVIVTTPAGTAKVTTDHRDLGNLIGRLCSRFDLVSDQEQREAIKRTIKSEARQWLDEAYNDAGYKDTRGGSVND